MIDPRLKIAEADCTTARADVALAFAALESGRARVAEKKANVIAAKAACAAEISAQARDVAVLLTTADASYLGPLEHRDETLALRLADAEHAAAVVDLALVDLQSRYDHAASALAACEAEVARINDVIRSEEEDAIALDIIALTAERDRRGAELRARIPNEIFEHARPLSPTVQRALELLPPVDLLHTPVNQIHFGTVLHAVSARREEAADTQAA